MFVDVYDECLMMFIAYKILQDIRHFDSALDVPQMSPLGIQLH